MVAGMGGLSQGFMDLVEGQDRAQMMSPAAIMSNLEHGNMLMGPQMRPALTSGPGSHMPSASPKPITSGGGGMMIQGTGSGAGGKLSNVGQQII